MRVIREPRVKPTPIRDLRPTQMTVGMREVAEKRKMWRNQREADGAEFLGRHMIPVILGPKHRPYVIDHHHLTRALHDEGVEEVLTTIVSDLSHLTKDAFWVVLDNRSWLHPFDAKGERCAYKDVPTTLSDLVDDPYRSLAGALRRAGGYSKETTPFSEFLWADFFRRRIKLKALEQNFDAALKRAFDIAKTPEASYLPGWCGPTD